MELFSVVTVEEKERKELRTSSSLEPDLQTATPFFSPYPPSFLFLFSDSDLDSPWPLPLQKSLSRSVPSCRDLTEDGRVAQPRRRFDWNADVPPSLASLRSFSARLLVNPKREHLKRRYVHISLSVLAFSVSSKLMSLPRHLPSFSPSSSLLPLPVPRVRLHLLLLIRL